MFGLFALEHKCFKTKIANRENIHERTVGLSLGRLEIFAQEREQKS